MLAAFVDIACRYPNVKLPHGIVLGSTAPQSGKALSWSPCLGMGSLSTTLSSLHSGRFRKTLPWNNSFLLSNPSGLVSAGQSPGMTFWGMMATYIVAGIVTWNPNRYLITSGTGAAHGYGAAQGAAHGCGAAQCQPCSGVSSLLFRTTGGPQELEPWPTYWLGCCSCFGTAQNQPYAAMASLSGGIRKTLWTAQH